LQNFEIMKTKLLRNVFALAVILSTAFSCSKFEDGPKVSLRSVMNRIYGTYRVEYISKNGVDMTDSWNNYYDLVFKIYRPSDEPKDNSPAVQVYGSIDSSGIWKSYGIGYQTFIQIGEEVYFPMHNYMIDTSFFPGRCLYPVFIVADQQKTPLFKITRLSNNEMWLYLEEGNDVYEIHLKE